MSSRQYRPLLCGALCAAVALIITACVETGPTVPTVESIELAKGGVKDPTVKEAVPDSAQQSETLDVHVFGSGFDDGSVVEFTFDGIGGVSTTNTRFVSQRELVANIDVAIDAEIGLYDVEVTTSRDKKGIGTEMFRVRKKVNNGKLDDLDVTGFTVEEVDHALGGDRCTDISNPCNKLVFEFTGTLDSIVFKVAPNFEGKYRDPTIEHSSFARGYLRSHATAVLVPTSPGLVEAYWQGQWQPVFWETPMGPAIRDTVQQIPNLDLVEGSDLAAADHFVFSYAYAFGTESRLGSGLPYHEAVYTGWTSDKSAYVTVDVEAIRTAGRGKKKPSTTQLQFTARTFKDAEIQERSTTLHADSELLLTDPLGNQSLLKAFSGGMDYDDPTDLHKTVFLSDSLTETGCYEVRVIGVDCYGGPTTEFYGDRFYVWDRSNDAAGAAPLGVEFDAPTGTITTTYAGGCPPQ